MVNWKYKIQTTEGNILSGEFNSISNRATDVCAHLEKNGDRVIKLEKTTYLFDVFCKLPSFFHTSDKKEVSYA